MKKEGKKINIAVIVSIVSVIIAIISLCFSSYIGYKDIQYKEYSNQLQTVSQELEQRGLDFDSTYKKISLAEKSIMEQMDNCKNDLNEIALNKDLRLLINSRDSLIKDDISASEAYLKQINTDMICPQFGIKKDNSLYYEACTFIFIWIILIICFFIIKRRK